MKSFHGKMMQAYIKVHCIYQDIIVTIWNEYIIHSRGNVNKNTVKSCKNLLCVSSTDQLMPEGNCIFFLKGARIELFSQEGGSVQCQSNAVAQGPDQLIQTSDI